ncbi:MAG TPA: hypothetical protein VNQ31_01345 [Sphingomonadaceae bacterium]|nr:hypothetical protein [Sphingomonadaceae bacterium]
MKTPLAALAALLVGLGFVATPVQAQRNTRTLVIFGNDKCPTSNGEEIVVCVRRSENERYRIPPEFRKSDPLYNQAWADRAESLEYVGASGAQSCSPVGPGGASGCFKEMVRKAKAEDREAGREPAVRF